MELTETSPNPTPGLYIDLESSSPCSGFITAWNLCYYNPENFVPSSDTLPILLQVWRNSRGRRYSRIAVHMANVVIASSLSVTLPMRDGEFINILEGDLLGVTMFSDNVLPVVANSADNAPRTLFVRQSLSMTTEIDTRLRAVTILSSNVIHVTAQIGKHKMPE